ncbi:GNAT family N-acetyltransferase [Flagellimonas aquimarina]|uniref:GNAT family N-acetyltransferase n=1 Tax=Flagellimonas aquimarina TaxID=2201895 RepID=A0A316L3B8_9FLAO|nr:GNAT family N-acetyltransferase [Allomuricauda koreensis]PWL39898.1 GNAT family N-acetyltransferase [Allomuricauda koreensis]
MKNVTLNGITYRFAKDFKDNQDIRLSFNKLTESIFGFSLEDWYQNGYWGNHYIPYSLMLDDEVISNVSVTRIEFLFGNERKTGIQIGTVMTDEKYRHRGLNKFLLEQVINEWEGQSDFIYLFANSSVLDFYPKFNFRIVNEYQHSKPLNISETQASFRRLNIEENNDKELLIEAINNSIPISKISMRNNTGLILFYCLSYKKNSIYYIDKLNAIIIADIEGDTLYLNDVFSNQNIDLNYVIKVMSDSSVKRVVLGFAPLNPAGFNRNLLKEEDTLFILNGGVDFFKDNYFMFPVLSHA